MVDSVGNKYKLALRGAVYYLLFGGLINIGGIVCNFFLKMNYGNAYCREHHFWLYIGIAEWLIFIIAFGLKYVENIGYIDDYDHLHYASSYFRRMSLIMLYLLIPAVLSISGIGAVFSYATSICYEPSLLFSHLVNNKMQLGYWLIYKETMAYWPQLFGLLIMLPLNLLMLLPFYYLGKKNRREDLKNGYKLRIKD